MRESVLPIQFPAAMLALVVQFEIVNRLLDICRDDDGDVRVCRPSSGTQDVDVEFDCFALGVALAFFESLLVGLHFFTGELDVLEHLFQIHRETAATLGLQSAQHAALGICACTAAHEKTASQVFLVESLEDSFAMDEAEQIEDLVKLNVDFGIFVYLFVSSVLFVGCVVKSNTFCHRIALRCEELWDGFGTSSKQLVDILGYHLANLGVVRTPCGVALLRLVHECLEALSQSTSKLFIALESGLPNGIESPLEG